MSPVEMWGIAKSSRRRSAWVPLPAPGGPSRIRFSSDKTGPAYPPPGEIATRAGEPAPAAALLQEALVAAHHQLRLELLHRFQRHPDDDQDRRAAEVELLMGAGEQDRRERRHGGQEESAGERQAGEDPVQELGRRAA